MNSMKTTKSWTLSGSDGFESLKFNERYPLDDLTDHDVLIRLHAVSLNYRDVAIPKVRLSTFLCPFMCTSPLPNSTSRSV
jgi:NADPH:quinone reductase-like Zn-dependent oxidoreductase